MNTRNRLGYGPPPPTTRNTARAVVALVLLIGATPSTNHEASSP